MKTEQRTWSATGGWEVINEQDLSQARLVLVFGSRAALSQPQRISEIRQWYPNANIMSASTAGEIQDTFVNDDTIVVTAIRFDSSEVKLKLIKDLQKDQSYRAGKELAAHFSAEDLVHLFVLCDGLKVNGSELARGFNDTLPTNVTITGGLAGDGPRFEKTLVGLNEELVDGGIVAAGFYGKNLKVGYGSVGGWDPFGPVRLVTRSEGNVLYELDGQKALGLYKKYLGEQAEGLPGTGLHFPLSIKTADSAEPLVRTILAIDEEQQSLTFAGDIPVQSKATLMKANFERIIEGASAAANKSNHTISGAPADLAVLISCVGRKLILSQRIEEEVEGVRAVLGDSPALTGFYSYGELAPFATFVSCELHNQTMTITTFSESAPDVQ